MNLFQLQAELKALQTKNKILYDNLARLVIKRDNESVQGVTNLETIRDISSKHNEIEEVEKDIDFIFQQISKTDGALIS